jgi:Mn-dependent DtxR family transcriptional regulator
MTIVMEGDMRSQTRDTAVLELLDRQESATIEQLMEMLEMNWEQVFSAIDRLSRTGKVRLTRVGGEYYAEKTGGI